MKTLSVFRGSTALLTALAAAAMAGCGWQGANSLPLPGTAGDGAGAFEIQAQLPNVSNIERNSRVRVGDITVGNITRIELQGWHALVTMTIDGDVDLPANSTATVGQSSLFGSLHIELAPPADAEPRGRLHNGSMIPLPFGSAYPTTEQALAAVAMVLSGGGLGRIQEITTAFNTAFAGRESDVRSFIEQLDRFIGNLDAQKEDLLAATDRLNAVTAQVASQEPILQKALQQIPEALVVLAERREVLVDALDRFGSFSDLASSTIDQTTESLVAELRELGPVLKSLADAGPAMTRALSLFSTYPWPNETIHNWFRGDYANITAIFDLTLSRLDSGLLTGTRFEGALTELELQWGRTIGQLPSPYTAANPLVAPYRWDQGP